MNDFDRDIKSRAESSDWGRDIAGKILSKRRLTTKRNRVLLLTVVMPAFLLSAGFFYQLNRVASMKNTLDSAITETFSDYSGDHLISQAIDEKIMQYCMAE
ncbi:MAG: hypothetical protein WCI43_04815 [Candidatus Firestonebacteria bacterium]